MRHLLIIADLKHRDFTDSFKMLGHWDPLTYRLSFPGMFDISLQVLLGAQSPGGSSRIETVQLDGSESRGYMRWEFAVTLGSRLFSPCQHAVGVSFAE